MNKTKQIGLLFLILCFPLVSNACDSDPKDLGVLSASNTEILIPMVYVKEGQFTNQYMFTVDDSVANKVIEGSVGKNQSGYIGYDMDQLAFDILDSESNSLLPENGPVNMFALVLGAGTYYLNVTGLAEQGMGGKYALNLSAVPLPPAVFLFGSAILGLVVVGRRRVA